MVKKMFVCMGILCLLGMFLSTPGFAEEIDLAALDLEEEPVELSEKEMSEVEAAYHGKAILKYSNFQYGVFAVMTDAEYWDGRNRWNYTMSNELKKSFWSSKTWADWIVDRWGGGYHGYIHESNVALFRPATYSYTIRVRR